jgi:hypothetical protein
VGVTEWAKSTRPRIASPKGEAPEEPAKGGKARRLGKGNLGIMDLGAYLRDHKQPYHEKKLRDKEKAHLTYFVLENG